MCVCFFSSHLEYMQVLVPTIVFFFFFGRAHLCLFFCFLCQFRVVDNEAFLCVMCHPCRFTYSNYCIFFVLFFVRAFFFSFFVFRFSFFVFWQFLRGALRRATPRLMDAFRYVFGGQGLHEYPKAVVGTQQGLTPWLLPALWTIYCREIIFEFQERHSSW